MAKIGFIGVGNMGGPMATNLIKDGHEVKAFDVVGQTLSRIVNAGASQASSPADAASDVEAVVTMLPAGQQVSDVYTGTGEVLANLARGTLIIDSSTIDVATSREMHAAAADAGFDMLDAPVSGGVTGAEAGTLTIMCGGSAETFARAKPYLDVMGKNIFHAGGAGSGQVAKACNNMLLAIHMIGTTEALSMGARNGLDPGALSEIMRASSGNNWSLDVYNPYPGVMPDKPASNDFKPGFMTDLMVKDLGLAMDVAAGAGLDVKMGALAKQVYEAHQQAGNGALDFSSIINRLGERP